MSKVLGTLVLAMVATLVSAERAFAVDLVVGPAECVPWYPHYQTIQDAVNAAVPGDTTIYVCPGVYREQVVIQHPMIIQGVDDGSGDPAVIALPAGGLVPNVTLARAGSVAAQLVVQDTWGVVLTNLVFDGEGLNCAETVGASRTAAVALRNLQSDDPSWISSYLGHSEIRNHVGGCGRSASGIIAEASLIEIDNNYIHALDGDATDLHGAMVLVTNNYIAELGFGGAVLSHIENATIAGNTMTELQFGISLESSVNINIWSNTLGPWIGYGVYARDNSLSWLDGNNIEATFFGIWLERSQADRVTNNLFGHTQSIGLIDIASRGGNEIWDNTFDGSPVGINIDEGSVAIDNLGPNVFVNVTTWFASSPWPF